MISNYTTSLSDKCCKSRKYQQKNHLNVDTFSINSRVPSSFGLRRKNTRSKAPLRETLRRAEQRRASWHFPLTRQAPNIWCLSLKPSSCAPRPAAARWGQLGTAGDGPDRTQHALSSVTSLPPKRVFPPTAVSHRGVTSGQRSSQG